MDSILDSVKKMLGIEADYTQFDADIIMHINAVFVILCQLGVGPENCFFIEDNGEEWADFFGENPVDNMVKVYMYQKVRMLFDPPLSSVAGENIEKQIAEFEWRMGITHDLNKR